LHAANVHALLQETADQIDSNKYPYATGWNPHLGYGRVNAQRALAQAPGYTNTPAQRFFGLYDAKGKLNYARQKLRVRLKHTNRALRGFTGVVDVSLNGTTVAQFASVGPAWRWNSKETRGRTRSAAGSALKLTYSKTKAKLVLKLKAVPLPAPGADVTLRLVFGNYGGGEVTLVPDAHGKLRLP
jgi:hypothetical protein